ncbi:MAG: hypothetical protein ACE366_00305 [Bradymonadia bacterium]
MTSIWIAIFGGIGATVVARIGFTAYGRDPVALGLSVLIGAGLLLGLVELWRRARRAHQALDALNAEVDFTDTTHRERLPAHVRGPLEGALAGHGAPGEIPGFTPYLAGLVVMLGLIGTFLGLVEALSGAREALVTGDGAADVDGLRSGLVAPMQGLTRAFGTSVAGVAASASLGLCLVWVRRVEARVRRRLDQLLAGPLAHLTPAGRHHAALDALVSQSAALPQAAEALQGAVERLDVLGKDLARAHGEATRATTKAHLDAVAAAEKAHREATMALEKAHLEATTRAEKAHREATASAEQAHREATANAEKAHHEAVTAAAKAHHDAVKEASAAQSDATRATVQALTEGVKAIRADLQEASIIVSTEAVAAVQPLVAEGVAKLTTTAEEHVSRLQQQLSEEATARQAESAAHLDRLREALQATVQSIQSQQAAQGQQITEGVTGVMTSLDATAQSVAEGLGTLERQGTQWMIEIRGDLSGHLEAIQQAVVAPLEATAEAHRAKAEALDGLITASNAQLEAQGEALAAQRQAMQTQHGEITAQLTESAAQVSAAAEGSSAAIAALGEALTETVRQGLDRRLTDQQTLEAQLTTQHEKALADLGARLVEHAQSMSADLASTGDIVREAAELARASGVELSLVAELFTEAVDRYRGASEAWLDTLARLEGTLSSSGDGQSSVALGQYLDQTREVFSDSLRVQQALFAELRSLKAREAS